MVRIEIFLTPLIAPALIMNFTFLLAGLIMLLFPPKKINGIYGYRTTRSMKNQENWDKAQRFSAIKMIQISTITGIVSLLLGLTNGYEKAASIVSIVITLMSLGYLFYATEKHLKSPH